MSLESLIDLIKDYAENNQIKPNGYLTASQNHHKTIDFDGQKIDVSYAKFILGSKKIYQLEISRLDSDKKPVPDYVLMKIKEAFWKNEGTEVPTRDNCCRFVLAGN